MPTFRDSRDFLLANRTDYAKAMAGFRWPDPVPFNWAIDWFDDRAASGPVLLRHAVQVKNIWIPYGE